MTALSVNNKLYKIYLIFFRKDATVLNQTDSHWYVNEMKNVHMHAMMHVLTMNKSTTMVVSWLQF